MVVRGDEKWEQIKAALARELGLPPALIDNFTAKYEGGEVVEVLFEGQATVPLSRWNEITLEAYEQ